MVKERLEVRLDGELRRMLEELAELEGASISETVRTPINQAYEERMLERRLEAVRRIATANVGEALEPAELKRLLDEAAGAGDLR